MARFERRNMDGLWTVNEVCEAAGITRNNYEYFLNKGVIPRATQTFAGGQRKFYTEAMAQEVIAIVASLRTKK